VVGPWPSCGGPDVLSWFAVMSFVVDPWSLGGASMICVVVLSLSLVPVCYAFVYVISAHSLALSCLDPRFFVVANGPPQKRSYFDRNFPSITVTTAVDTASANPGRLSQKRNLQSGGEM
jgi:hypothetical protein